MLLLYFISYFNPINFHLNFLALGTFSQHNVGNGLTLKIHQKATCVIVHWKGHNVFKRVLIIFQKDLKMDPFHFRYYNLIKWPFCSVLRFRYINSKQNVCHFLFIFNSDNIISNEGSVLYSISGVFILKIGDGQGQNIIYERPSMYSIPAPVHRI